MLNLYAVKVWHPSAPRYGETINVRTYTIDRAECLATENFPGCIATARPLVGSSRAQPASHRRLPTNRTRALTAHAAMLLQTEARSWQPRTLAALHCGMQCAAGWKAGYAIIIRSVT